MGNETCRVQLPSGITDFRSTSVKPYNKNPEPPEDEPQIPEETQDDAPEQQNTGPRSLDQLLGIEIPSANISNPEKSTHGRLPDISTYAKEGQIRPPTPSFKDSRQKEITGLQEKGTFLEIPSSELPPGTRVFGSRFVDEIKFAGTDKAMEKSRLVIQAYNHNGKETTLTQSPTLQRVSQRLLISLAACLRPKGVHMFLRDISQAYVQSTSELNRPFYIHPPKKLGCAPGNIFKVVKPLYGIAESGNHWFKTYHDHHTKHLGLAASTYDHCLLHRNDTMIGFAGM